MRARNERTGTGSRGGQAVAWMTLVTLLACLTPSPPAPQRGTEPVTVDVWVRRAETAEAGGDYDTAILAWKEAHARTPWNPRLARALAAAYVFRAEETRAQEGVFGLESAEGDLREARRLLPDDPTIRQNLATLLVERSVREMDPDRARTLRDEARSLDPELAQLGEGSRADIERRLDLAYELLQRGQVDAGIERLESLHTAHPEYAPTTRLLAQALVRKGVMRAERGRHHETGPLLDRAVGLYADLAAQGKYADHPEFAEERRVVHRGRVVAWINASRPEAARQALADAERAGFPFPDLSRAVDEDDPFGR